MYWSVPGNVVDVAIFGRLEPIEVLFQYDVPMIFTAKCEFGDLLCYLADDDGQTMRYILAPTNLYIIENLKTCACSLLDALDKAWCWFVDVDHDGNPIAAWQGTLADVPSQMLPDEDFVL